MTSAVSKIRITAAERFWYVLNVSLSVLDTELGQIPGTGSTGTSGQGGTPQVGGAIG
jgi:hypothetical protein